MHNITKYLSMLWLMLLSEQAFAIDSYRFLHVTIDTPWMIFIGLLVIILFPFILTAVLHWYYATHKQESKPTNNE